MIKASSPKLNFIPVQKVLWRVLWLNLFVALIKISVGLFSGLLSMVADGFHSLMDAASNIVGLVALRIAQAPPDVDHPYGHRKAETLATLFIGILLAFATYEILSSALHRLMTGSRPHITAISFGVMLVTILINLLTSTYEHRRGQALKSEILLADAIHTRTDIWVSCSVLVGLIGVQWGWIWLDAAVGLAIAIIIGYGAVQVLRKSINVLMDQASIPSQVIETLALAMPDVESIERIRSRGQANETYIDLHLGIAPDTPTDQAHSIAHAVQDQIKDAFPQVADVTIHVEPEETSAPDEAQMIRRLKAIARSLKAEIHDIWLYSRDEGYFVELHLEVPTHLTLVGAHHLATTLEAQGQAALPTIAAITTHIEPMGETVPPTVHLKECAATDLKTRVQYIAANICGPDACHDVELWPEPGDMALSMHCTLPSALSIVEAHTISERVQDALRRQLPQLKRVIVHVEPVG